MPGGTGGAHTLTDRERRTQERILTEGWGHRAPCKRGVTSAELRGQRGQPARRRGLTPGGANGAHVDSPLGAAGVQAGFPTPQTPRCLFFFFLQELGLGPRLAGCGGFGRGRFQARARGSYPGVAGEVRLPAVPGPGLFHTRLRCICFCFACLSDFPPSRCLLG